MSKTKEFYHEQICEGLYGSTEGGAAMKTLTWSDFDQYKPCYSPAIRYGEWSGTILDLLRHQDIPLEDCIWAATRHGILDDKTLRLFACKCVREVWHLLTDERSRRAVEVAEMYAMGQATDEELAAARAAWAASDASSAASDAASDAVRAAAWAAWEAASDASDAASDAVRAAASSAASDAARAARAAGEAAGAAARKKQVEILIELIEEVQP